MKSPSPRLSPTLGSLSVFTLLAVGLAHGAPTGPPPPLPYGLSLSPPSLSPSQSPSPTHTASPPTPLSSPPLSPVLASSDGFSDELSGLGITIPLHKKATYLVKRGGDVVDLQFLIESKANVLRKFGGSLNPSSPLFGSPLVGGDPDDGDESDGDEGDEEATGTQAGPTPSEGASVAAADSSADVHVQAQTITLVPTSVVSTPVSMPSLGIARRQAGNSLTDEDSLWMGPMTIGGQDFQVDFDTGSSDLWVPGPGCSKDGCQGHKKYTKSSTGVKRSGSFSITYGDGSKTSGPVYTDGVAVAGLSITNQTFSPVNVMSPSFANPDGGSGYPADGIAGMGFPALSQTRSSPFFQTLVSQHKVPASIFSFRLASSSSELYLGGINSNHYSGDLTYATVTQKTYWTIGLGGVKVGNKAISIQGKASVIDTGTTLVYGSYDDVTAIYKAVPGSKDMSKTYGDDYKGYWLFPCNQVPSISLAFGGRYFTIPASALNLGRAASGSSDCVGAVVGQDPDASGLGTTFLVGDAFLTSYYSVFDVANARVGFAPVR